MLDFSVTFIITIINIAVLCFILKAILWKPVTKFMASRARRIEDSIEKTEKDKAQAKALLAQYAEQLEAAETEAAAIIKSAKEQAQIEADKIIADSRASAQAFTLSAKKELESERQAALAIFRQEAAALVIAASSRLVGREIKGEDNRQYAAMLINETSFLETPFQERY